jgi:hypothetical protein
MSQIIEQQIATRTGGDGLISVVALTAPTGSRMDARRVDFGPHMPIGGATAIALASTL